VLPNIKQMPLEASVRIWSYDITARTTNQRRMKLKSIDCLEMNGKASNR